MTDVSKEGARGTSGADDLRNEFAQTLAVFDGYDDEPEESIAADYLARANDLLELIADPALRLAILDAMGLEAWEGQMWTKQAPSGSTVFPEWVCTNGVFEPAWSEASDESTDVLVVRPRGEAT